MLKANPEKIFDFNVKRYEEHRKCLLDDLHETRNIEKYVLLVCGALYSWLATNDIGERGYFVLAVLFPSVLAILALFRTYALIKGARTQAAYLRELENEIYNHAEEDYQGPKGWENYLYADGSYIKRHNNSALLFWYCLLVINILVAIAFIAVKAV